MSHSIVVNSNRIDIRITAELFDFVKLFIRYAVLFGKLKYEVFHMIFIAVNKNIHVLVRKEMSGNAVDKYLFVSEFILIPGVMLHYIEHCSLFNVVKAVIFLGCFKNFQRSHIYGAVCTHKSLISDNFAVLCLYKEATEELHKKRLHGNPRSL
mgnify:CR=1 FL=1